MRVHRLIVKCDKVLYWTRTSVFQYLVKPSTVGNHIFDTRFFIFDVYILKIIGKNSFGHLCERTLFQFLKSWDINFEWIFEETKGRSWWTLKMGSGVSSFSTCIAKMLWWPNVDNLPSSWWAVSTCACFWGQKVSTLCAVALIASLFLPWGGKLECTVTHLPVHSVLVFFFPRGKVQCHVVRMQLLDA